MAAVATVISYVIQFALMYKLANNILTLPFVMKELSKIFLGSVVAGTGVFATMSIFVDDFGIVTCGLLIIEFIFIYFASLLLLKADVIDFKFKR